ncbi:hypothetical protein D8X55_01730 [Malacoplasma penetrans]|uniref:Predicted coiled-coil structure containing protein n=1 Tax=Malacoplasma penetrans (strain HF-2) TaxID=272633 RepID=Q8EWQ1_MALP2|nr:hypothetical protein [Malacoplasma penetrans]RXY96994.1 hypothetical protein D8X55_01730 [Malacoplasma penetrans]BAC43943.1 predicted coiled-coil structure containing protein [Malacoplasma penetrans HF-2]
MNNTEKNFSVFSRNESKKFSNEYFLKKIKNNYELVPDFDLTPVQIPKTIINNNENFPIQSVNKFEKVNLVNQDINLADSSLSNPNLNNDYLNNLGSLNNDDKPSIQNVVKNNSLLNKHLNSNLDSSYSFYDGDDSYLDDDIFSSIDFLSDDNNLLMDSIPEEVIEPNQPQNFYNQNLNTDLLNNNLDDTNDYLDNDLMENDELSNDLNSMYSLETFESNNLSNLLDIYNIKSNLNSNNLPDDFFNYISRNRIKEIVIEKLGYCDEEMLDELHSLSIIENWKDLDVQKWLLNPENVNKFKNVAVQHPSIQEEAPVYEPIVQEERQVINPIFKTTELDNNFFDFRVSKVNDSKELARPVEIEQLPTPVNTTAPIIDEVKNLSSKIEALENSVNQNVVSKEKNQPVSVNEVQESRNNNRYQKEDTFETNNRNRRSYFPVHKEINYYGNKYSQLRDNSNTAKSNDSFKDDLRYEFKENLNLYNKLNFQYKNLEKEMSYKFDSIANQINKINGEFKSTMIEELYRNLLINNQTETLKNYINEKVINVSSLFGSNNKSNKYSNFINSNSDSHKKNINPKKFGKHQNEKLNKLNQSIDEKISNIDSQFKNLQETNQNKFNEINESLKKIIDQINVTKEPNDTKEIKSIKQEIESNENVADFKNPKITFELNQEVKENNFISKVQPLKDLSIIDIPGWSNNANLELEQNFDLNKDLSNNIEWQNTDLSSSNYEYKPNVNVEFESNKDFEKDLIIESISKESFIENINNEKDYKNFDSEHDLDTENNYWIHEELIDEIFNEFDNNQEDANLVDEEIDNNNWLDDLKNDESLSLSESEVNDFDKKKEVSEVNLFNELDLFKELESLEEYKEKEETNNEVLELKNDNFVNYDNKYKSLINVSPVEFPETVEINDEVLQLQDTKFINYENKYKSFISISPLEFPEVKEEEEVLSPQNVKASLEDDYFQKFLKDTPENNGTEKEIIQTSKLIQKKEKPNDGYQSNDIFNFFSENKNDEIESEHENLTNEKDSLKTANSNYNQLLDSKENQLSNNETDLLSIQEKKNKEKEAVTEELLSKKEETISHLKENLVNELDDVIYDLKDLNIKDNSIYDIENLKIKFKNI